MHGDGPADGRPGARSLRCRIVFILLPPSETKAPGGEPPALDLGRLLFPELTPVREALLSSLARISADPPTARAALGVSAGLDAQIAANTHLRTAPAMPALRRYTGVLYDALDAGGLTRAQRARAADRILVASALFGAVRASDRIPAYRLSAGSHLPGSGTIAALWKRHLTPLLAGIGGPVVDLRSGAYAALAPLPLAITVRVVTERPDGSRAVVSHFNKHAKGLLARLLAVTTSEPGDAVAVARVARRGGLRVERLGESALQVVT